MKIKLVLLELIWQVLLIKLLLPKIEIILENCIVSKRKGVPTIGDKYASKGMCGMVPRDMPILKTESFRYYHYPHAFPSRMTINYFWVDISKSAVNGVIMISHFIG